MGATGDQWQRPAAVGDGTLYGARWSRQRPLAYEFWLLKQYSRDRVIQRRFVGADRPHPLDTGDEPKKRIVKNALVFRLGAVCLF